VQQRERRLARVEGLHGQVQHHRGVLADRVQHHGVLRLGGDLPDDVDALGLERPQMVELRCHGRGRLFVDLGQVSND
jgi:hypothetical protein